jgi:nitrate reductase NapE component
MIWHGGHGRLGTRSARQLMMESRMRDIVLFLVFGFFVWTATVVGFVSLYA